MQPIIINLTKEQAEFAIAHGSYRYWKNTIRNYSDYNSLLPHSHSKLEHNIRGVGGQVAFWMFAGCAWTETVEYLKHQPDFLPDIEIRTTLSHDYNLIVYYHDHLIRRFVLVTTGVIPWQFWLHGWIYGFEAERIRKFVMGDAWLVGPERLHDL